MHRIEIELSVPHDTTLGISGLTSVLLNEELPRGTVVHRITVEETDA